MCELFGVTANRKIKVNSQLKAFFSHSIEHRNGWGLALFDDHSISIEKEPIKAADSIYLKSRLAGRLETARCMAHIRKATVGDVNFDNTHPFSKRDESGRTWVLVHNGTIFDSPLLNSYQYVQQGDTDSERILLYLVDQVNHAYKSRKNSFDAKARVRLIDQLIRNIVPGNKVNLLIYDGDYFYVHKNEEGTLFMSKKEGSVIFSTHALTTDGWEEVPQNRLMVFQDGEEIYEGKPHEHSYIYDEDQMKHWYLGYAAL